MSVDLRFNPWKAAITYRLEWRALRTADFIKYDLFFEPWNIALCSVWLVDVKTFTRRSMRFASVIHPYTYTY